MTRHPKLNRNSSFPKSDATANDDVQVAFDGLQQIDEARSSGFSVSLETSSETSAEEQQTNVEAVVDPFDEDFEEEVLLQDTYSPFVARQNQSSLTVTSENLSHLSPIDERESTASAEAMGAAQADEETAEADALGFTAPSGFVYPSPPADTSFVPVQSVPSEFSSGIAPEEPAEQELVSAQEEQQEIDPELAALTSEFPFDDDAENSIEPSGESSPESISPFYPSDVDAAGRPVQPSAMFDEGTVSQFVVDEDNRVADEIRHEAEEIAQELRSSIDSDVSHGTDDPFDQSPPQGEVSSTDDSEFSSSDGDEYSGVQSAENEVVPPLDQTRQVLQDIMNQQRLVSEQQQQFEASDSAQTSADVDSVSVEYPITDHQNYQTPSDSQDDDRDMLRVSESQYSQSPQKTEEERSPLADATPSTGEARRMDYEKLFQQLRDMPKQ